MDVLNKIEELLKQKGITGYRMCADLHMSRSFLTELRSGRTKGLGAETAKKLADYFGVSVDYLLGNEKAPAEKAEAQDEELADILREFRDNPDLRTLFSVSRGAKPEEIRKYAEVIKALRGTYRD